jgi:transaldolase/glucose-6-phosphate isomerase
VVCCALPLHRVSVLIAESTGKQGKGIIPVDRETVGAPSVYRNDRVFAYLRLEDASDAAPDAAVAALEKAGKPVITIRVATKYDLSEEFVRWEIATAIAGAVMGINPFNQPEVEASKIATKALTSEYEKTGNLPSEAPFFESEGIKLFADAKNAGGLTSAAGSSPSLTSLAESASRPSRSGRLLCAAGICRHERRARSRSSACPALCPRREKSRDLSRVHAR